MTFNVTVPNSAQSPGLFPSQNNDNFQRIKDIVNADHNFVDTAATNQGAHKQVSFINRSSPGSLPAGIQAIEYTKDVSGVPQLFFYNGVVDQQVTPSIERVATTLTVPANTTSSAILTLPNAAEATIFVCNQALATSFKYYLVFRSNNTSDVTIVLLHNSPVSSNTANVVAVAASPITQVALRNINTTDVQTYFYSIIINRL